LKKLNDAIKRCSRQNGKKSLSRISRRILKSPLSQRQTATEKDTRNTAAAKLAIQTFTDSLGAAERFMSSLRSLPVVLPLRLRNDLLTRLGILMLNVDLLEQHSTLRRSLRSEVSKNKKIYKRAQS